MPSGDINPEEQSPEGIYTDTDTDIYTDIYPNTYIDYTQVHTQTYTPAKQGRT